MTQRGSEVLILSKAPSSTKFSSQIQYNPLIASKNPFSLNSTPHKNAYTSALTQSQRSQSKRLSSEDVTRLTGSKFRQGQLVKGQSRISYIPYEKKIVDYETRTYTQMRPKTKRIVDYQEKTVIENVPRQVIRQEYYPVHKITKVYKQIVDIKPVQKKVKKLQYFPVEKKIVHYPENQDYKMIHGQSKIHLQNPGVFLKQNAQYRPLHSNLRYQYTGSPSTLNINIESQQLTPKRLFFSKSPSYGRQSLSSSKVEAFKLNPSTSRIHLNGSRYVIQPEQVSSIDQKGQYRVNAKLQKSKQFSAYASTGKLSAAHYL